MGTPHFVIAGGGTAGWITAFIIQDSLRRNKLEGRVTVVEPSRIPTVGVGEASTAAFNVFLQHFGIDEFEFFRETGATFKLGIRHEDWRRPEIDRQTTWAAGGDVVLVRCASVPHAWSCSCGNF